MKLTDKQKALEDVKKNGLSLHYVSDELKNDKEIVLEAVKEDGRVLQFASTELKKEIICA